MIYPLYEPEIGYVPDPTKTRDNSNEVFLRFLGIDLMEQSMISIIVPLYNERDNVIHYNNDLFPIIDDISKKFEETFEFIFVDD